MRGNLLTRGLPVVVFGFLFLIPSEAHARRRGFFLITTGETVKHVDAVPADKQPLLREMTGGNDVAVGFLHDRFGVFFLDLWTWDGEYCLYEGDNVWPLEADQAAAILGKPADQLGKPFLYRFPPLLMLLVVGGVAFVGVVVAKRLRGG